MRLYEFLILFPTDTIISVWDLVTESYIYQGISSECPDTKRRMCVIEHSVYKHGVFFKVI